MKPLTSTFSLPTGVDVRGPIVPGDEVILSPYALSFLATMERLFRPEVDACLRERRERQARLDAGERPDFLVATKSIRESEWEVAQAPPDLEDRRVEITGPVDRKMIINALNSGAKVFMADFEDSTAPTWRNVLDGQTNLHDAVRRTITYAGADSAKEYRLNEKTATLMVRPRGWHLVEKHVLVDGVPVSASIFDFALYFLHNVHELMANGTGPYFYLPKLESRREARLWNDVFRSAQDCLGIRRGTVRATVLIETILAAFEMDEILWELREHSAGLNCGRWDFIFSWIKKFRTDPAAVLPDRSQLTMDGGFLRAYSQLLIKTCHRRRAHAMGGMAAQIPIRSDPERNRLALEKVREDKRREAADGHDGTWVAHPGLVGVAMEEFDAVMPGFNQIHRLRRDVTVTAADLLRTPTGTITESGLRQNVAVGLRYLEAWLGGSGCVPLNDLMEDAATAEISRAQLWQWIKHRAQLSDGRPIEFALVSAVLDEETVKMRSAATARPGRGTLDAAATLFRGMIESPDLDDFLTIRAYDLITSSTSKPTSFS